METLYAARKMETDAWQQLVTDMPVENKKAGVKPAFP